MNEQRLLFWIDKKTKRKKNTNTHTHSFKKKEHIVKSIQCINAYYASHWISIAILVTMDFGYVTDADHTSLAPTNTHTTKEKFAYQDLLRIIHTVEIGWHVSTINTFYIYQWTRNAFRTFVHSFLFICSFFFHFIFSDFFFRICSSLS